MNLIERGADVDQVNKVASVERENSTNKQPTIYCQVTVSHLRTLTHQGQKTEKDI
jgi:hypothetical protein